MNIPCITKSALYSLLPSPIQLRKNIKLLEYRQSVSFAPYSRRQNYFSASSHSFTHSAASAVPSSLIAKSVSFRGSSLLTRTVCVATCRRSVSWGLVRKTAREKIKRARREEAFSHRFFRAVFRTKPQPTETFASWAFVPRSLLHSLLLHPYPLSRSAWACYCVTVAYQ